MIKSLRRLAIGIEDWARYGREVPRLVGGWKLLHERFRNPMDSQGLARSIRKLCSSARLASRPEQVESIQQMIHGRLEQLDEFKLDWLEWIPDIADPRLPKAAILKPYLGKREKGVVFISFENQWVKLLRHGKLAEFAAHYDLVIAPSSSPHNLVNYVFAHSYPGRIFTLISNPGDLGELPSVSSKLIPIPIYASQWVNPDRFHPRSRHERDIDLLMVASFGKVKRHHSLFRALRRMPKHLRIVLIGQDQEGRTSETIIEEARAFGVEDRFTVQSNRSYAEVIDAFCRARASVVLSRREGSCVVVTESMFADTPVAILQGAELGSRVFINEQTGRTLAECNLAEDLASFVKESDRYRPLVWAQKHLSCYASSRRLNDTLKENATAGGQDWSQDIATLEWSPDPLLVEAEDRRRLACERTKISRQFDLEIGPDGSAPKS